MGRGLCGMKLWVAEFSKLNQKDLRLLVKETNSILPTRDLQFGTSLRRPRFCFPSLLKEKLKDIVLYDSKVFPALLNCGIWD
jgi:hypothetical protein